MNSDGLDDISYNFLIGSDGVVYVGRGWYKQSEVDDPEAIVVAFIGNFFIEWPNKYQLEAFEKLMAMGLSLNLLAVDCTLAATCDRTTSNSPAEKILINDLEDFRRSLNQCANLVSSRADG